MGAVHGQKKKCAKNFLEEATKAVQLEASGRQNESPYKEELERLRVSSDMRLDGTLMLHAIKAGKAGDWTDVVKNDWLKECRAEDSPEEHELPEAGRGASRRTGRCHLVVRVPSVSSISTGGVHRNTGTSSATGGTRRAVATTTGGTRTES